MDCAKRYRGVMTIDLREMSRHTRRTCASRWKSGGSERAPPTKEAWVRVEDGFPSLPYQLLGIVPIGVRRITRYLFRFLEELRGLMGASQSKSPKSRLEDALRKIIICVWISIFVTGCGPLKQITKRPIVPDIKNVETFSPDVAQRKSVGEVMVQRGNLTIFPGFVALTSYQPPQVSGVVPFPVIQKKSLWTCDEIMTSGEYVCRSEGWMDSSDIPFSLSIRPDGNLRGAVSMRWLYIVEFNDAPQNLFGMETAYGKNSYREELIYNGKSKDTIRLSYREYKNDMARPAFYQDLTYDLSESREIAFRDLRIEVLEATNSAIKFIVKK
jgi:hypothetical protein